MAILSVSEAHEMNSTGPKTVPSCSVSENSVWPSCCVSQASERGSRGLCRTQIYGMGSTGALQHLEGCSLSLTHCTDTLLLQPGLCCTQTKAGLPELYPNKLHTSFHRQGIVNGNTKRVLAPLYGICKTSTGVTGYTHILGRMSLYLKNEKEKIEVKP